MSWDFGQGLVVGIFLAFVIFGAATAHAEPDEYVSMAASRDQRDIAAIMDQAYTIGTLQARVVELEELNEDLVEALRFISMKAELALDPQ